MSNCKYLNVFHHLRLIVLRDSGGIENELVLAHDDALREIFYSVTDLYVDVSD